MSTILNIQNLVVRFKLTKTVQIHAVNDVSVSLKERETVGIVGESGCGKSVTFLSILGLIPKPPGIIESGSAIFNGKDLFKISSEEIRKIRGSEIGFVFQDPMTSLNPVLSIGNQLSESVMLHRGFNRKDADEHSVNLLKQVGIPEPAKRLKEFPHQFSGGMRQRVMFAMAISCNPRVLIADEPTTALDVTVQAQLIDLVKELRDNIGMAVVWITHDLGVISGLADVVNVMFAGSIVEKAPVKNIFSDPQHPYTQGLIGSLPHKSTKNIKRLTNIPGTPPDGLILSKGCSFAPRCSLAIDRCHSEIPLLKELDKDHHVACWLRV